MGDYIPDISSMKISELKSELDLYCVDHSGFCEKKDFTSALQNARDTLPRPSTKYHEVEQPKPKKEEKKKSSSRNSRSSSTGSGGGSRQQSSSRPTSTSTPSSQATPVSTTTAAQDKLEKKRLKATRSAVTALQQIREHPSEKLVGERNNSFLPGSPFSFALKGTLRENDAAILRIPEGVCLRINSASVDRKELENFFNQKGSIGVSLKVSTEENPALCPIWTFDKERSKSYTVSDLGLQVCGPRTIKLLANMEMGFRSGASVDVYVFGSVGLDTDMFGSR
ncbi:hypothetical protein THAOC_24914 [Thalassiosira oceanica]|uniref:Uncharacterized protein n=1 Tax=Thalassiosira oceanica TaxID=159749 RepID=K0RNL8_THAOC|nr:hypothetical protein THAOC_24914 [Thalassiosira oceanica]|mmetsp:Transcript_34748/g.83083  ORF Transcript_34748/g.83083 Transcript_34748/m.83083 type:complete len:281 (-) Transcript_34748:988-1830(-)|eukprot:EJK55358.1 hypothetical protein THAOC_24914 [Thalassiosira oceanica]